MVIDLNPMLRGEIRRAAIDFSLAPDLLPGITFPSDARVEGEVVDRAGYMRLSLAASIPYVGECARCLSPVRGVFTMTMERTVVAEGTLSEEQLEENVDEYIVLRGGFLDPDETVREELLLTFPTKLLCSEDCPGLCPVCGKPRREGDCGCSTKEIDPRLAVLKKILDKDDKV